MTDLYPYRAGTDDDALLVSWYVELAQSGDLHTTFLDTMHSLTGFLDGFRGVDLLLGVDEGRVWAAIWIENMKGTAFLGIWVAEEWRGTVRAGKFITRANTLTTTAYPTVLAITRQPAVVELACHLGYTTHGWIPGLWSGYPAYLLSSTKESRDGWRQRRRGQLTSGSQPDQSRNRTNTSLDTAHEYQCERA